MALSLDHLVSQIGSLPTLPSILQKVTELVNNPKTSAIQLSRLILDDQALTARLLRLVNSPFYGFPRRISTVTEAVTILGFHAVRNLLVTATVVELLRGPESKEFSPAKLWEHAVGTAVAAGLLARYTRHEDREEIFVAGLLHDVGKLVIYQFFPKEFVKALLLSRSEDVHLRVAEQRLLGFTHDQAGSLLAERWKLPVRLCEAVAFHHRPDLAQTAKREAAIIHLADLLCRALALGLGGDDAVPPLSEAAWQRLGLAEDVLDPLMAELEEQYVLAREVILGAMEGGRPAEEIAHVA
jgi:putative nucleotidyltransferase with HDIG domain